MNRKRLCKRLLYTLLTLCLLTISATGGSYFIVSRNADGRTYDSLAEIPHNRFGLLLATSPVTPHGWPNSYFTYRLIAAEQLYRAGKIDYIIASGGDYRGRSRYSADQPAVIRDTLVAHGIPADRIILDYDGRRTIGSIRKARLTYRLDSVTLISQKYHNERAIYQADHYGLHAIGYNAGLHPTRNNNVAANTLREALARLRMYLDLL